MVTGRFANESVRQRPVRQRLKSIRQRRMSVHQRRQTTEFGASFTLARISIIPRSFIHCGAKQTAKYVYPELNAIQLFLFLVLSSTAEPNENVFWTLGPEVTSI